jgi:hypothetical protein
MKSVPNFISYIHKIFWIFSQFLAIYSELFSSESKFNSEITDMRGPPVSHRFPRRAIKAPTDSAIPTAPLRCPSHAVASPRARPSRPRLLPCPSRATAAPGSEPLFCPRECAATIFR